MRVDEYVALAGNYDEFRFKSLQDAERLTSPGIPVLNLFTEYNKNQYHIRMKPETKDGETIVSLHIFRERNSLINIHFEIDYNVLKEFIDAIKPIGE